MRDRRPALISSGLTAILLLAGWVGRPAPLSACTSVVIASSNEKYRTLNDLAVRYNAQLSHPVGCDPINVRKVASGTAERKFVAGWSSSDRPDVWSPAAATWVELVRQQPGPGQALLPVSYGFLAKSPLVIGMPEPMARALGWPDKQPSWLDLLLLAQDPSGWGRFGHPEWGQFSLGQTDPRVSTSGLHALIASYYAATGKAGDLIVSDVNSSRSADFIRAEEAAVAHYSDTAENFLRNLKAADDNGSSLAYVSAVTLEEQEVWQYNQGQIGEDKPAPPPRVKLVPVYPSDGTLFADHPYLVLNGIGPGKARLANEFFAWVQLIPQQRQLAKSGFRVQDSSSNLAGVSLPGQPARELVSPAAAVISLIQQSWSLLRKRARILIVVDATVPAVREQIASAIGQLAPDDQVGVWAIGPRETKEPYVEIAPIAVAGADPSQLKVAVGGISPEQGTVPLLAGIEAAYKYLKANPDPRRVAAVLVVAGGKNDDARGPSLVTLLGEVRSDPRQAITRVFGVSTTADDDDTIARIAQASGGVASTAHDPQAVAHVLDLLVADF